MSGPVATVGRPFRGDVKVLRKQHGTGIRRPPENGIILVVPRENAVPVRFEYSLRTEVSTDRKQAFRSGLIDRGKTKIMPM